MSSEEAGGAAGSSMGEDRRSFTRGHHTVAEIGRLHLAVGDHMVLSRGLTSSDLGAKRISGSCVDFRGRSRRYCGDPFRD